MNQNIDTIMERVTTKQAAKELAIDIEALQYLMRNDRLPIGYAMKKEGKKRYAYYIYRGLLDSYKSSIREGNKANIS